MKLLQEGLLGVQLFGVEDQLYVGLQLSVIDEQICTLTSLLLLPLIIILKSGPIPPVTLRLNTLLTKETHQRIIKLQPPILLRLNIRNIMSRLRIPNMNNNATQLIIILGDVLGMGLVGLLGLVVGQAVGVGVEGHGELVARGYFLVYERVQVEYDALQVDY